MKITVLITRTILALIFIVFGLNFFFPFIPVPKTMPPKAVMNFQMGLMGSGYFFQFLKGVEIISGLLLLFNRFSALILVILFPITLNIFLFHAFLMPSGLSLAFPMLLINLFLGYAYRKYYAPVFTVSPVV